MKLLYNSILCSMVAGTIGFNAAAQQQLPNYNFEGEWVDCVPWTFYQDDVNMGKQSTYVNGTNPANWNISNVCGMVSLAGEKPFAMGATKVGEKVEGYNSASAVKLTNNPNPFMATQIVPGYLTLGTPWSTAHPTFAGGIQIKNSDGGAFGGIEFTQRPSGIEFMYKRSRGVQEEGKTDPTIKPEEKTTVVAYLWKGHWTQKDVPAIIYMTGEDCPVKVDMIDRDRCILGIDTPEGSEVTKSDDAELIAVINAEITEDASEWTKFSAKFDYKSDATPEMINVVIAAGDYFGGAEVVGKDNSIVVDDVRLLYDNYSYPGYLNVTMNMGQGDMPVATDQAATIKITPKADGKCDFLLPNLALDGLGTIGDIALNDVTMTTNDGVTTYSGTQKGMQLLGGAIVADVTLNGTIDANGNVNMKIDVIWTNGGNAPINVSFTSVKAGIGSINADNNAPVEYYNIQGIRVSEDNLTPGLYIKRQGNIVKKVIVK